MDVSDIIRDEDLEAPAQAAAPPATGSSNPAAAAVGKQKQKQEATAGIKRGAQDLMAEMLPSGTSRGSRNMLKRKAKSMSRDGGKRGGAHGGGWGRWMRMRMEGKGSGRQEKDADKECGSDGKEDNKCGRVRVWGQACCYCWGCVKEEAGEGGGKGGEDNRAERSGFDLNELLVCKVEDTEASVTNQEGVINQNSGGRARMGLDLHLSDGMQSEEMGEGVVRNLGNEKSIEGIKVEANTDEAEEKSKREGSEKAVGKGLDLNMEVSEEANEGKHVDGGEVAEEKNGEEKESALVVAQRVRAAEKGATATMESARKAQLAIEAARKAQADNELFLEDCAIRLLCIFALDSVVGASAGQVRVDRRLSGAQIPALQGCCTHTLDVLLQMQ
ncbi:unnamed protein product, partial [Closterium sp. NIES-65]